MVAIKCGFEHAVMAFDTAVFLVADLVASSISMEVITDQSVLDTPGKLYQSTCSYDQIDLNALTGFDGKGEFFEGCMTEVRKCRTDRDCCKNLADHDGTVRHDGEGLGLRQGS